jgi:CCR4-NOT transcription complex subunit 6
MLLSDEFRICSYNILAQKFMNPTWYPHLDPKYASWDYRQTKIFDIIVEINADIYCLQEVDIIDFDNVSKLLSDRYTYWFSPKVANRTDGCAILYRKNLFQEVSRTQLQLTHKTNPCVAQFLALKHIYSKNKCTVICNTHLIGKPDAVEDRVIMIQHIVETCLRRGNSKDIVPSSIVLCGDFNCSPKSAAYKFMKDGIVEPGFNEEGYTMTGHQSYRHNVVLRSAQSDLNNMLNDNCNTDSENEPAWTFNTGTICKTMDYMWYNNLILTKPTCPRWEYWSVVQGPLPDAMFGSDHVPIIGQFKLKQ